MLRLGLAARLPKPSKTPLKISTVFLGVFALKGKVMKSKLELRIKNVKEWPLRKGKAELLNHLTGNKQLSKSQAIAAKCYDCQCGYESGEEKDCKVTMCPLYDFQPYKEGGARKIRKMSDEQKQAASERMKKIKNKI